MNTATHSKTGVLLALSLMLTAGCTGKTEDVRFKLCKEVTERLLDSMTPITWKGQTSEIRSAGDAATRLSFNVSREGYEDRLVTAACFFRHDLPEENVIDHVDPLSAYSTLPYMMTIENKTVPQEILAKAVSAEQLEPFREFAEQVRRQIEQLPTGQ